jgi:hypothetical protein
MNDESVYWAFTTPVPSSRQVGEQTVRMVLTVWILHADQEGVAWPSYERLAAKSGLAVRQVRDAIQALEEAGILGRITRPGIGSRAIARQVLSAGCPAINRPVDNSDPSAGHPATNRVGLSAGASAGLSAGASAGHPAWKKKKKEKRKEIKEKIVVPVPSEREWQKLIALPSVGVCGHELIDDRHCWRGCAIAVNA